MTAKPDHSQGQHSQAQHSQAQHSQAQQPPADPSSGQQPEPARKSRARVVKAGRLPVSEFAFDRAGAASPFGDDVTLPVPPDQLTYEHPQTITFPPPPEREHHEL